MLFDDAALGNGWIIPNGYIISVSLIQPRYRSRFRLYNQLPSIFIPIPASSIFELPSVFHLTSISRWKQRLVHLNWNWKNFNQKKSFAMFINYIKRNKKEKVFSSFHFCFSIKLINNLDSWLSTWSCQIRELIGPTFLVLSHQLSLFYASWLRTTLLMKNGPMNPQSLPCACFYP